MRPDTKRSDMVQAILEGVAFAVRDNLEIAKSLGISIEKSTVCGGGAKSSLWRKILCNVLNIELKIPKTEEGPGFGAALISMVAYGKYNSVNECASKLVKITETLNPDNELVLRYEKQYKKFSKIYPAVKNLYKELK